MCVIIAIIADKAKSWFLTRYVACTPHDKLISVGSSTRMRPLYNLNSFLASGNICCLRIAFANSLDPDQDRQNVAFLQSLHCVHYT